MESLNLYIYLLNITLVFMLYLIYYYNKSDLSMLFKVLIIWLLSLLILNFYSMRSSIQNYITNSEKKGKAGKQGDIGPRGFTGNSDICGNCKPERFDYYGDEPTSEEIKKYGYITKKEHMKMGYCKLPFVYNHVLYNAPLSLESDSLGKPILKENNNEEAFGWCATKVTNDLTMKTFGYYRGKSKNDDLVDKLKNIKTNYADKQAFLESNSGVINLELVSGSRSNVKCPDNYRKIDIDLNNNANGNYVYLCEQYGISEQGVKNVRIINGNENCPGGFSKLEVGLNDGVPRLNDSDKIKMCVNRGVIDPSKLDDPDRFIKNIKIVNNDTECDYSNFDTKNLNQGTDGDSLHLCYTYKNKSIIIDAGFLWPKNNSLYFFKEDNFWKIENNNSKKIEGPNKINNFWGKIIGSLDSEKDIQETENNSKSKTLVNTGLDAVYTDPFDNTTYLFKGTMVYAYNHRDQVIQAGYPKKIQEVYGGFPKNIEFIDAIWCDNKNKIVYFFKGKLYYKFSGVNKIFESGKQIKNLWMNTPDNLLIKAVVEYNNKTYIIGSGMVYEVNQDNTLTSSKMFDEVFPTLINAENVESKPK